MQKGRSSTYTSPVTSARRASLPTYRLQGGPGTLMHGLALAPTASLRCVNVNVTAHLRTLPLSKMNSRVVHELTGGMVPGYQQPDCFMYSKIIEAEQNQDQGRETNYIIEQLYFCSFVTAHITHNLANKITSFSIFHNIASFITFGT